MSRLEKSKEDFLLTAFFQWREGRVRMKRKPKEEHKHHQRQAHSISATLSDSIWISAQIWLNAGQLLRAELGGLCCKLGNLTKVDVRGTRP